MKNNKLTECNACNNNVSKTAPTCPHCGQMNPAKKEIKLPRGLLLFTIVFFIFILGLINTDYATKNNKKTITKDLLIEKVSVIKANSKIQSRINKLLKNNVKLYKNSTYYTKSKNSENIYFVGGYINNKGTNYRGVWAVYSGFINESGGLSFSVDAPANKFSVAPDAKKSNSNISMNDGGYKKLEKYLIKTKKVSKK